MIAKNDKEWHRLVCEREGYVCQGCGRDFSDSGNFNDKGVNQYVCGHHDKRKGAHPELRLDTDNGKCTCDFPPNNCHTTHHLNGSVQYKPNKDE